MSGWSIRSEAQGDNNSWRQRKTVLVVDDEPAVHALMRNALAPLCFRVDAASGAAEALTQLDTSSYDLIITDLMMPGLDGLQLLERLRGRASHIPVLMVTGCPTVSSALQAMRLGAQDYLTKPFSSRDLLGPVRRALRMSDAPPRLQEQAPAHLGIGDVVFLPRHAWARLEQDGTFAIGIESEFLQGVGSVESIACPPVGSMVDQGFEGIRLVSRSAEQHAVRMPLTGEVLAVKEDAVGAPSSIDVRQWLIRIVPRHLQDELPALARREVGSSGFAQVRETTR